MRLLVTATALIVSFIVTQLGRDSSMEEITPERDLLSLEVPGFVDVAKVYDVRNLSVVGLSTTRSTRDVVTKTRINFTDALELKIKRLELKLATACRAQHSYAVDIVETVERIVNLTTERSIYDDPLLLRENFDLGALPKVIASVSQLEKGAQTVKREYADLGDRLSTVVTDVTEAVVDGSPDDQYLFGESLIQFTSSSLFIGNIVLAVSGVEANLVQLSIRLAFIEDGKGSVEQVIATLESLYEAGLTLVVPSFVLEEACRDALL